MGKFDRYYTNEKLKKEAKDGDVRNRTLEGKKNKLKNMTADGIKLAERRNLRSAVSISKVDQSTLMEIDNNEFVQKSFVSSRSSRTSNKLFPAAQQIADNQKSSMDILRENVQHDQVDKIVSIQEEVLWNFKEIGVLSTVEERYLNRLHRYRCKND